MESNLIENLIPGQKKSSIYIVSTTDDTKSRTNDNVNFLDIDGATEEQGITSSDLSSDGFGAITNNGATRDFFVYSSTSGFKISTARQFMFQFLIDGATFEVSENTEHLGSSLPEIMTIYTKISVPASSVVTVGTFQVSLGTLTYTKFSLMMVEA